MMKMSFPANGLVGAATSDSREECSFTSTNLLIVRAHDCKLANPREYDHQLCVLSIISRLGKAVNGCQW